MAASKPVIHGRDHLPGGADPIPGLHTLLTDATFVPNHAEGRYQITGGGSVTVASNTSETIEWAYISGDAVLDLSSPTAPEVVESGWYDVSVTYSSTSGVWTEGSTYQAQLEFHGAQSKFNWSTVTIGKDGILGSGPGALGGPRQGFVSLCGHMRSGVGDYIAFILRNFDSISHDMTCDTINVSRVYAYPT